MNKTEKDWVKAEVGAIRARVADLHREDRDEESLAVVHALLAIERSIAAGSVVTLGAFLNCALGGMKRMAWSLDHAAKLRRERVRASEAGADSPRPRDASAPASPPA